MPPGAMHTMADDPFMRIDRMAWPGPNQYRSADGSPGPAYWQQRADYAISATLDTTQQRVSGEVRIRYTNNSPDSLHFVWLQLDQNIYRPGSRGSAVNPADSRWGARNFPGGYDLGPVTVNGVTVTPDVHGTVMRLDLDSPIPAAGGTATIRMRYAFRVPEHGSDRMGRDSSLYEIAQWYPRLVVYDDVRGWNTDPYLGQGEFYLEYGSIDYSVTVPAGYVVAGSGVLQNPEEVLTATQRARLAEARRTDTVVHVITRSEAVKHATPGTRTWRFHADSVRDVAWAAAPDFRWDATSWNGILAQAFYQFPKAGVAWESAAEQTQWTIRNYSELFYPFPYPQATSVAGPVGGMEYPMFVMVHYGSDDPRSIFGTINHEHGHEWFPMTVGSNERRYAWMDEGFNTYINGFANERRYPSDTTSAWPGAIRNWTTVQDSGIASPLMTPPDRIDRAALGAIGYRKPAAVLYTLRNHVLDPSTFDRAFRTYIRRWAFKHPTPGDFFRTMENVSGEDLSWFWRAFFYSNEVLDIGIDSVWMRTVDGQQLAQVELERHTAIPFPVSMRLALANGSTSDARFPVQLWGACVGEDRVAGGGECSRVTATVAVSSPVVGVRLWPDPTVPDWNRENDTWGQAPPPGRVGPVTTTSGTTSRAAGAQSP